jgi:RNA polymerase sigma factor (sigma-70 family)
MSIAQLAFPFSAEIFPQSPPGETASGTSAQIEELLDAFDGEPSLKHLFWELLSYDRVRDPLPLSILPPSAIRFMTSLEVFAATEVFTIVIAVVQYIPLDGSLEQMVWAVKRNIANCVVLLNEGLTWSIIYPDEILKPRVRILPLPGPKDRRAEIVQALCALNTADDVSGEEFTAFELAQNLDESFPGATPNIGDILTDFERIAEHPNEELRELWQFIRMAGQYPLLKPAQERGEDLTGDEVAPDGSGLNYQQWRLVVHNLRLVLWMARKVPKIEITLADLVQEGCTGLMIAAKRFDPNRGFRFTTYAFHWVKQSMFRALHNQCNLIRWPVYRAVSLIPALIENREDGLRPGEKPVRSFEGKMQRRLWMLSLTGENPIDSTVRHQAQSAIDETLLQLKRKQRVVIERRYGLRNGVEETLECIGLDMGLTRERVRQLQEKSLFKLGKPLTPRAQKVAEHARGFGNGYEDTLESVEEIASKNAPRIGSLLIDALREHWNAMEWRQSCDVDEGSVLAQAPFRDFMQGVYNQNLEG